MNKYCPFLVLALLLTTLTLVASAGTSQDYTIGASDANEAISLLTKLTPNVYYTPSPTECSRIAVYTDEGIFGGTISAKKLELSTSTDSRRTWHTVETKDIKNYAVLQGIVTIDIPKGTGIEYRLHIIESDEANEYTYFTLSFPERGMLSQIKYNSHR